MPEQFGDLINIPEVTISGVFPWLRNYPLIRNIGYSYQVHKINLKKEQRILRRNLLSSWRITANPLYSSMTDAADDDLKALFDFYDAHRSPLEAFYHYDMVEASENYDPTGAATTGRYVARFSDADLDFRVLRDRLHEGTVEIIEVNTSTTAPLLGMTVPLITETRYPVFPEGYALLSQADITSEFDLVHMIVIAPQGGQAGIRVADRRCNGAQTFGLSPTDLHGLYQPRLLGWNVEQKVGESDSASFTFDDADRVWWDYCKQVDLYRASLKFFLHLTPNANYQLSLWRGYITDWSWDERAGTFTIQCKGGISQLDQDFPIRYFSTVCPLDFNDGGDCPYAAQGSGGDPNFCDRSREAAQGCLAHGMGNYFQGAVVKPLPAFGRLPGRFHRAGYTSVSTPLKTAYGVPIPVIYGNGRQIVEAIIFEVRDESEFLTASGFVSEGPVGSIGQVLLDGQTQHLGFQPVRALGGLAQNIGTQIDANFRCSRLAFCCVRRTDEIGFKNPNEEHKMLVEILDGVKIRAIALWTGPFFTTWEQSSSNPVQIAGDIALRTLQLRFPPDTANYSNWLAELIHVASYTLASQFCDASVPKLFGAGTETRFQFRGQIRERKPAIDHVRETLANTPIDLIFSFGMLKFKPRIDDITTPPSYTVTFQKDENIIDGSFNADKYRPEFNHLSILFSDLAFDFNQNEVAVFDKDQQKRIGFHSPGGVHKPLVLRKQIQLTGTFAQSQVYRLAVQLLREELGGKTEAEQTAAKVVSMKVPLIGLAVEVGDVSPVLHPDLPNGKAYVRWHSWRYSDTYEIELQGKTVTESMYVAEAVQTPSTSTGVPVTGIPGGSQGSTGSENQPPALTAPVLSLLSVSHKTAAIGITSAPPLVNYLVIEESLNVGFTAPTITVMPPPIGQFNVGGTVTTPKWVRAKWRRTLSPLEESSYSNVLAIDFSKITAGETILPQSFLFVVPGIPLITTDACFYITAKENGTFTKWELRLKSGFPATGATIADVHKNGVSIFNNGGNRPTILTGQTLGTGTTFDIPTFVIGDVFRFDIDAVGLPAGERLQCQLFYTT